MKHKGVWLAAWIIVLAAGGTLFWEPKTGANGVEERLLARIKLADSYFAQGNVNGFISMWSARNRRVLQKSKEARERMREGMLEWGKGLREGDVKFEHLAMELSGQRARVKRRVTITAQGVLEEGIVYDHWVLEKGEWYLDETDRSE